MNLEDLLFKIEMKIIEINGVVVFFSGFDLENKSR
jgi:hypothetical protein